MTIGHLHYSRLKLVWREGPHRHIRRVALQLATTRGWCTHALMPWGLGALCYGLGCAIENDLPLTLGRLVVGGICLLACH